MPSPTRRKILWSAVAVGACAALLPVSASLGAPGTQAPTAAKASSGGSSYYGVWIMKSWSLAGQTFACPVQLPVPPGAPPLSCGASTYLKLFRSGKYETTIPAFDQMTDKGTFGVLALGSKTPNMIVFDDSGEVDAPRAYRLGLSPAGSKSPTKLTVSSTTYHAGVGTSSSMNFVRYTG